MEDLELERKDQGTERSYCRVASVLSCHTPRPPVLFDLDETLVKIFPTPETLQDLANDLNNIYRRYGVEGVCKPRCMHDGFEDWFRLALLAHDQLGPITEECNDRAEALVLKTELEGARSAVEMPSASTFVAYLAAHGYEVGVVTSNGRQPAEICLDGLGIRDLMFTIEARPSPLDQGVMKPQPGALLTAVSRLSRSSSISLPPVYIGDSPRDMTAARRANFIAVGVATGRFNQPNLVDAGANVVFDSLADIDLDVLVSTKLCTNTSGPSAYPDVYHSAVTLNE